jgi:uncharacterized protein YgiM (DUF1202 family)
MFEQHPVPQNISSYQFHLVGDMTLKQFLELAAGVVVGVLIYATGLPGIIKWPLIIISALIGALLAFVPFEERPLEQWIIAFIRSVYSPTLFHWQSNPNTKYFAEEAQPSATTASNNTAIASSATLTTSPDANKLEVSENNYLTKLMNLFNPQVSQPIQSPAAIAEPQLQISQTVQEIPTQFSKPVEPVNPMPLRTISVPQTGFVSMEKQNRPQMVVQEIPVTEANLPSTPTTIGQVTPQVNVGTTNTQQAQFSTNAAPPSLPTIIDTISGQVMDNKGCIIEGAVLEILDTENRPVRALKTNKAGHFLNVTALTPGKYKIIVEKEGYNFDPIEFETTGAIIQPIGIRARSK